MRRSLSAGLLLVTVFGAGLTSSCAWALDAADPATFTEQIAKQYQAAQPDADVAVAGLLTLTATARNGEAISVHLDRMYLFCQRQPKACDTAVAAFVANEAAVFPLITSHAALPVERSMLRVVVRPTSYVAQILQVSRGDPAKAPIVRPVAGNARLLCYADLPTAMRPLSAADLKALGIDENEAIRLGLDNVATLLKPLDSVSHDLDPDEIGILQGDDYESSRFLLHDAWEPLARRLGNRLIVAVPETHTILYAQDTGAVAVDALAAFARHVGMSVDHPLMTTVFRWTPTGWDVAD